jgi:UDP-glucose 4-epimerase
VRIVVTGANGFVGAQVVRALASHHDVLAIDCLRVRPWRFRPSEDGLFKRDTTDLRDGTRVARVLHDFRPDATIHLAAMHFIPECEHVPTEATSINVLGTVNLLAACPPGCRFVFASTAAVYAPLETAHDESSAVGPLDVYGLTKLHAEDFVRYYTRRMGLASVIVRLFNVIGAGDTNPHVVPEMMMQLRRGERTLRLGNVHPRRDYIHVADAAAGLITVALHRSVDGATDQTAIVNLGTGSSYSVIELVEMLSGITGESITVSIDPSRVRPVDRPLLVADNTKMRSIFGWAPRWPIDEALRSIWQSAPSLQGVE